jgi:hypothetical protein
MRVRKIEKGSWYWKLLTTNDHQLRSSARPDIVANGVLVHRAEGPPTEYEVFFEQDVSKDEATIILLTFTYWTLHHAGFGVGVEPSRGLAHTPTYRGGDAYTWRDSTLTWRGRVQRIRVFVGGEPSIGVTDLDGQTATLPILSRSMEAFGTIPELRCGTQFYR